MIRIIALATLTLTALAATAAAEPARPVLKASATVTSDLVRIGDLIDNAGIVADIPIFRAPNLGQSGTVSAASVADAVRSHAIIGLDTRGIVDVTVTRPSHMISGRDIQKTIARLLGQAYTLGEIDDIAVTFEREPRSFNIEPSASAEPRVLQLGYDARTGRFDAQLEYPGQRPMRWTGTALPTIPAVIMARSVGRGEIVRRDDVTIERRPKTQTERDTIASIDAVIGRAARQALRAGSAVRGSDLMKPEVVQRDASVTLIYTSPGITLTVRGKANEAGAEGEIISVTNLQSKRVIQGTVAADGSVIVQPTTPRIIANLEPATERRATQQK
ncbi:MAG TPA: flagellar basal body P-ring formation chaperone FlgA [Pseudolabrys sp.]|jgi:flagella basal body P-ring formation protein FlgA